MASSDTFADSAAIAGAISFVITHGGVSAQPNEDNDHRSNLIHFQFAYRPTPFPISIYRKAVRNTPVINLLMSRVAADHDYLREKLADTGAADPDFTGRLLSILERCPDEPPIELFINRTDYLIDERHGSKNLVMVETNTVACACTSRGTIASRMHRLLRKNPGCNVEVDVDNLPHIDTEREVAKGIGLAHKKFIELYSNIDSVCVIAFVISLGDEFFAEIPRLKAALFENESIPSVEVSLAQIHKYGRLENGHLTIQLPGWKQGSIISVAYFRNTNAQSSFPSEQEWLARELIEKSLAVKCPTIAVHLAGSKKMQQVLSCDGEVERFLDSTEDIEGLRATFAPHYSLSPDENGKKHAEMAIKSPEKYVMKGQGEGISDLFFSQQMKDALQNFSGSQGSEFVLMERLKPMAHRNILVQNGNSFESELVGELGEWGIYCAVQGKEIKNISAGCTVRNKQLSQAETGISNSTLYIGSPIFTDDC